VDGTHKTVPKFSHQLLTILGLSNGHYVPLVFYYWPVNTKGRKGYTEIYSIRGCKTWCESTVAHADFETSVHIAVTAVWPGCLVEVCMMFPFFFIYTL
jgi:hypothetical protein